MGKIYIEKDVASEPGLMPSPSDNRMSDGRFADHNNSPNTFNQL
jgi:hypothetical protein